MGSPVQAIARSGTQVNGAVTTKKRGADALPSCGFENPAGMKFCGEERDAQRPSKAVSQQVTVLFADLKGSMELLADRDPQEARQLLDPVLERMMAAVHRYGGDGESSDGRRHHGTVRGTDCA